MPHNTILENHGNPEGRNCHQRYTIVRELRYANPIHLICFFSVTVSVFILGHYVSTQFDSFPILIRHRAALQSACNALRL